MRQIFYKAAAIASALLLATGCHKELDNEIAQLKLDVSALEEYVSELNNSYSSLAKLVEALDNNDHIKSVEKVQEGKYKITFTSGTSITLRDGVDGEKPIIGIKYDSDSKTYFWTVRQGEKGAVQWIYDATGKRIRATATVPKLRVVDKHWEYSFDETNWNTLSISVGESGSSVFNSVKADEYFVTFILLDGSVFQFPTQKGFDKMTAMCDTVNTNLLAYIELLNSQDSNRFVKSVAKIEEGGQTVGYDIVLESGKKLTIRSGKDVSEDVKLSFGFDVNSWEVCWMYKLGDTTEAQFIYYKGKTLPAEAADQTPIIGVKDSAGVYYFTVKVGNGDVDFMRDSLGVPVRANPVSFFDEVSASNDTIKVTLPNYTGTKKVVNLCRCVEVSPTLYLVDTVSSGAYQAAIGEDRSFLAIVDSIPSSKINDFKFSLEASALDSAYVKSVEVATDTVKRPLGKWAIRNKVTFKTSSSAEAGKKTRVAVFLSWDNHTIMKVTEFTNKASD